MNMRPLVIDDDARAKAAKVIAYAETHHYDPSRQRGAPGDNPEHVAHFNSFRTVFSITRSGGKLWRHISVSVPGGKLPNPISVFSLCELFGLTGWTFECGIRPADDWLVTMHEPVGDVDRCIVVAQPVAPVTVH